MFAYWYNRPEEAVVAILTYAYMLAAAEFWSWALGLRFDNPKSRTCT